MRWSIWYSYNSNHTCLYGPRGGLNDADACGNIWAKPGEFKHLVAKLSTAIKHDSWGSLEEASTEYSQIATKVINFLAGKQSSTAKLEIEFMKTSAMLQVKANAS